MLDILHNFQKQAENYLQNNYANLENVKNSIRSPGRTVENNPQALVSQKIRYDEFIKPVLKIFDDMKKMLKSEAG